MTTQNTLVGAAAAAMTVSLSRDRLATTGAGPLSWSGS